MKIIYLDHASTTYTDPRVLNTMMPYFAENYGNPQSIHQAGKTAMIAVDKARDTISKILNCKPSEIIFTGSGTEANNLAIFGILKASEEKNSLGHIITSSIEHPSVIEPFRRLEEAGYKVTYLKVDKEGFVNPKDLEKSITPQTKLVSVMHANNEIGTIQPISELSTICKSHGVPFHTDCCQTAGTLDINTENLKVDSLTLNAGKIYGPKGVGALFIKRNIPIKPIIHGGGQERGLRSGTHNTAGIVGLAKALEITQLEKDKNNQHMQKLRDMLIEGILKNIKGSFLNGPATKRLPNNVSITIPGINASELMLHMDEAGIQISNGSACALGMEKTSQTLSSIGIPKKHILNTIRLTLGKRNNQKEIQYTIKTMATICHRLLRQSLLH